MIITDAMDMHAIAHRYGAGHAAVNALVAGADMVMALGTPEIQEETIAAIAAAIDDGTLSAQDVERAAGAPVRAGAPLSVRSRATTPKMAPTAC